VDVQRPGRPAVEHSLRPCLGVSAMRLAPPTRARVLQLLVVASADVDQLAFADPQLNHWRRP